MENINIWKRMCQVGINVVFFCFGLPSFNIIPLLHIMLNFLGQHYTSWILFHL